MTIIVNYGARIKESISLAFVDQSDLHGELITVLIS
jgi:hypothetical protein